MARRSAVCEVLGTTAKCFDIVADILGESARTAEGDKAATELNALHEADPNPPETPDHYAYTQNIAVSVRLGILGLLCKDCPIAPVGEGGHQPPPTVQST